MKMMLIASSQILIVEVSGSCNGLPGYELLTLYMLKINRVYQHSIYAMHTPVTSSVRQEFVVVIVISKFLKSH